MQGKGMDILHLMILVVMSFGNFLLKMVALVFFESLFFTLPLCATVLSLCCSDVKVINEQFTGKVEQSFPL